MRGDERRALELLDRVEHRVGPARGRDALPARQEPREHGGLDRFDLTPQLGERDAAEHAQHVRRRSIRAVCRRAKFAFEQTAPAVSRINSLPR
jgi:hypothetical protein